MVMPVGPRLLVRIDKRPERTAGGIYLSAETVKAESEASQVGVIVKMSPDCFKGDIEHKWGIKSPPVKEGDKIYLKQYVGSKLLVDNWEKNAYHLIWINDGDVLGLFEEGDQDL